MFEGLKKFFLKENLEKPFFQKTSIETTLSNDPKILSGKFITSFLVITEAKPFLPEHKQSPTLTILSTVTNTFPETYCQSC